MFTLTPTQKHEAAEIAAAAGYFDWCRECGGYRLTRRALEDRDLLGLLDYARVEVARPGTVFAELHEHAETETVRRAIVTVRDEVAAAGCRHGPGVHERPPA